MIVKCGAAQTSSSFFVFFCFFFFVVFCLSSLNVCSRNVRIKTDIKK